MRVYYPNILVLALKIIPKDAATDRISLTFDIWAAAALRPFPALTALWLKRRPGGSLSLESDPLAFHYLPGQLTGERTALALTEILDFFDIAS